MIITKFSQGIYESEGKFIASIYYLRFAKKIKLNFFGTQEGQNRWRCNYLVGSKELSAELLFKLWRDFAYR